MNKSIYSLVLMDDVVRAIDQLAYEKNTSRSNLINQILAEHVSLSTPEMRMQSIFDSMEKLMTETFQVLNQPSDSMMSLRSPLRYKYKPTIRYSLELYRSPGETIGRLRVALRTQNRSLLSVLADFFTYWSALEHHCLRKYFPMGIRCEVGEGRYIRELYPPANLPAFSGEDVGTAISSYIIVLDECIKLCFAHLEEPDTFWHTLIEERYRESMAAPDYIAI